MRNLILSVPDHCPYPYGYGVVGYSYPFAFKRGLLLPLTFPEINQVQVDNENFPVI